MHTMYTHTHTLTHNTRAEDSLSLSLSLSHTLTHTHTHTHTHTQMRTQTHTHTDAHTLLSQRYNHNWYNGISDIQPMTCASTSHLHHTNTVIRMIMNNVMTLNTPVATTIKSMPISCPYNATLLLPGCLEQLFQDNYGRPTCKWYVKMVWLF